VRTGDTPQRERARFARHPAEILITTPESLYLLLTSQASEALRTVDTVIIDEIHALVPTKRGAHLALSLERLEALTRRRLQRIGLSATQRPLEEVARFLGGWASKRLALPGKARDPGRLVSHPLPTAQRMGPGPDCRDSGQSARKRRLKLTRLGLLMSRTRPAALSAGDDCECQRAQAVEAAHRGSGGGYGAAGRAGIFAQRTGVAGAEAGFDLECDSSAAAGDYSRAQLDDLFVNSRQVAERLAGALNELAGEAIARAHHGSLAAAQRSVIEEQLKAGQIRALCATSTLELGIDMGAVDLVIQIEAPPSVASGMQRIGRAGHHVDAVSEGILFPKYRADLVACAAVTRAMHEGHIESTRFPRNPLDVLAQQLVAIVAHPPGAAMPRRRRVQALYARTKVLKFEAAPN
jgi:ATP-dependent Lhr-like helicase